MRPDENVDNYGDQITEAVVLPGEGSLKSLLDSRDSNLTPNDAGNSGEIPPIDSTRKRKLLRDQVQQEAHRKAHRREMWLDASDDEDGDGMSVACSQDVRLFNIFQKVSRCAAACCESTAHAPKWHLDVVSDLALN